MSSALTNAEVTELRASGSLGIAMPRVRDRASAAAERAERRIRSEALPINQAVARLGVPAARIEELLSARALVRIPAGRGWHVPRFCFSDTGPLPGLSAVLAALPRDIRPVAVEGFLRRIDCDLVLNDRAVSPREWLLAGRDPAVVATAAAAAYRIQ